MYLINNAVITIIFYIYSIQFYIFNNNLLIPSSGGTISQTQELTYTNGFIDLEQKTSYEHKYFVDEENKNTVNEKFYASKVCVSSRFRSYSCGTRI